MGRDQLRFVIPNSGTESTGDRLRTLVARLHPDYCRDFPLPLEAWVFRWRRCVEQTVAAFRPDIVVLCLGQYETPIVRRVCAERKVACLYVLTPFYEFKQIERLPLVAELASQDEYCVAGWDGCQRLVKAGVPRERIVITGTPSYDPLISGVQKRVPLARSTILYTEQRLPENDRLAARLLDFATRHAEADLVIRPHPSATLSERSLRRQQIEASSAVDRVRLSEVGSLLVDELAQASVLVTISSLSAREAERLRIPVICWWPPFLPSEMPLQKSARSRTVGTAQELGSALCDFLSGHAHVQEHWDPTGGDPCDEHSSATELICTRILKRLPHCG
jgi:hypothetical protein